MSRPKGLDDMFCPHSRHPGAPAQRAGNAAWPAEHTGAAIAQRKRFAGRARAADIGAGRYVDFSGSRDSS
jgi:hypothetical protein